MEKPTEFLSITHFRFRSPQFVVSFHQFWLLPVHLKCFFGINFPQNNFLWQFDLSDLFFMNFFLPQEIGIQPYRKVAVVEQFFDIIYNVHVGLGGRSGRHAGQKRTYRTVNIH